jgi:hypothetical protein
MRRFLHQSLSSASQEIAKTSGEQTMGKGEGVVVEADVGYKDGQAVFSPHGADQSHVEEDAQVCVMLSYAVLMHLSVDELANAEFRL